MKVNTVNWRQLNKQLEKAVVRAPFSGQIDDIMVEVGQVVSPGVMPLLRLVSTQKMYVEADVPERYLPTVSERHASTCGNPCAKHLI